MKTILAHVSGFTPIIDTLANDHGLVTAAVFGTIWRYCQMEDGVCRASLDTIADHLGVNRATVMRHAEKLVKEKYLIDLTPALKNRPHVYKDTGRAGMSINVGVAESNTSVAHCNTGVAESYLRIVSKKEKKKNASPPSTGERSMYDGYQPND